MSDLAKRPVKKGGLTKKAKASDRAVEIDAQPASVDNAQQVEAGSNDLAQSVVIAAEKEADQVSTLSVKAFAHRMQTNASVVASSKADITTAILCGIGDIWADAMQMEPSVNQPAIQTAIEGD